MRTRKKVEFNEKCEQEHSDVLNHHRMKVIRVNSSKRPLNNFQSVTRTYRREKKIKQKDWNQRTDNG